MIAGIELANHDAAAEACSTEVVSAGGIRNLLVVRDIDVDTTFNLVPVARKLVGQHLLALSRRVVITQVDAFGLPIANRGETISEPVRIRSTSETFEASDETGTRQHPARRLSDGAGSKCRS